MVLQYQKRKVIPRTETPTMYFSLISAECQGTAIIIPYTLSVSRMVLTGICQKPIPVLALIWMALSGIIFPKFSCIQMINLFLS